MNKKKLVSADTRIENLSKGFRSYKFGVAAEKGKKSSRLEAVNCIYDETKCMYALFHGSLLSEINQAHSRRSLGIRTSMVLPHMPSDFPSVSSKN